MRIRPRGGEVVKEILTPAHRGVRPDRRRPWVRGAQRALPGTQVL